MQGAMGNNDAPNSRNPAKPPKAQKNPYQQSCQQSSSTIAPAQALAPKPNTTTQNDLRHWLTTAKQNPQASPNFQRPSTSINNTQTTLQQRRHCASQKTTTDTPTTPPETTTPPDTQTPSETTNLQNSNSIQQTLCPYTENKHWGDPLHPVPNNAFRILSKMSIHY